MKNTSLTLLFLFFFCKLFSQSKYEFIGVIMINNEKDKIVPYRIVFEEVKGEVKGFSITDFDGEHETKSTIVGKYDKKTGLFSFKEIDILYTKSLISKNSFCFIHYEGKLKLESNRNKSKVNGKFFGKFSTSKKCLDGTLSMLGSDLIYTKLNKLDNKIQKSNRVTVEEKAKINTITLFDSLKINRLSNNERLNLFLTERDFKLKIFDAGIEDGDVIDLYQNDQLILKDYRVTKAQKIFNLSLQKSEDELVFKIVAKSIGSEGLSTPKIIVESRGRNFELFANLNKNEAAYLSVNIK